MEVLGIFYGFLMLTGLRCGKDGHLKKRCIFHFREMQTRRALPPVNVISF